MQSASSLLCTGVSGGRWCSSALSWQKPQTSACSKGPGERHHCCFASAGLGSYVDWLVPFLLTRSLLSCID